MSFTSLPSAEVVEKTKGALEKNGVAVFIVNNEAEAKQKVLETIPLGAEVMTMTSVTLETIGVVDEINETDKYSSVKKKLASMKRETQGPEMQRIGAAPEWAVGSVHAVTENGEVFIASRTGSQLPAYAYGSAHVVWVVGMQKIVSDADMAVKRIYEHCLPLESERARKAYGTDGSSVNKILRINQENKGRITMILVNEVIGF